MGGAQSSNIDLITQAAKGCGLSNDWLKGVDFSKMVGASPFFNNMLIPDQYRLTGSSLDNLPMNVKEDVLKFADWLKSCDVLTIDNLKCNLRPILTNYTSIMIQHGSVMSIPYYLIEVYSDNERLEFTVMIGILNKKIRSSILLASDTAASQIAEIIKEYAENTEHKTVFMYANDNDQITRGIPPVNIDIETKNETPLSSSSDTSVSFTSDDFFKDFDFESAYDLKGVIWRSFLNKFVDNNFKFDTSIIEHVGSLLGKLGCNRDIARILRSVANVVSPPLLRHLPLSPELIAELDQYQCELEEVDFDYFCAGHTDHLMSGLAKDYDDVKRNYRPSNDKLCIYISAFNSDNYPDLELIIQVNRDDNNRMIASVV